MKRKKLPEDSDQHRDLKKMIDIIVFTLIPLTVLYLICGILSDSITVFTITFDCGLSMISHIFAYKFIRVILAGNVFRFPYGTGKLENFQSFFHGALMIPTSFFFIISAGKRLFFPPELINFGISEIPLIPDICRSIWVMYIIRGLMKKNETHSPILYTYYVNFKVDLLFTTGVILALGAAFVLVQLGHKTIAYMIDPSVSILISFYMAYNGFLLTISNFKSIIDLPLPEKDQLKILNVLTREFDKYDDMGNIYTRLSGKTNFIEIELYFHEKIGMKELMEIEDRIEKGLQEHFKELHFRLIPLLSDINVNNGEYPVEKKEDQTG